MQHSRPDQPRQNQFQDTENGPAAANASTSAAAGGDASGIDPANGPGNAVDQPRHGGPDGVASSGTGGKRRRRRNRARRRLKEALSQEQARAREESAAEEPVVAPVLKDPGPVPDLPGPEEPVVIAAADPVPPADPPFPEKAPDAGRPRYGHGGSRPPSGNGKRALYAALDLGTNNCRLLVAEPQERGFRVVDAFSRIVRLGEGVQRTGTLSDNAMERAIEALHVCRKKLTDRGVERVRLIATEACRAALNGEAFLERVHGETGLTLEIVSRETEARLAVAGCSTLVDPQAAGVVLFDIGGGSSELVWLDLRGRSRERGVALTRFIRSWTSMPLGVVTLSERHGGVHVSRAVFEDMVADVDTHLDHFAEAALLTKIIAGRQVHMLGTSGTVTTLAGVYLGLERYDRRRVDGVWLDEDDLGAMITRVASMSYDERVANPCIGADRADLVLAGCAILEAIRRRWPCPRLRVADRGLREGILVELMAADGVWRRRRQQRRQRNRGGPS
uniref:Ppx/GppA phosphatase family protein n=1 Tax=Rhodobium gokarnense TaxID=364296 RepID=UPI0038732542